MFLARQEGEKMLGAAAHRCPTSPNRDESYRQLCCCISQNVNAANRQEETMTGTSAGCSCGGFSHFWKCEAAWEDI